jgi:hypothetical protein
MLHPFGEVIALFEKKVKKINSPGGKQKEGVLQGCQIFLGTTYQNGEKYTK